MFNSFTKDYWRQKQSEIAGKGAPRFFLAHDTAPTFQDYNPPPPLGLRFPLLITHSSKAGFRRRTRHDSVKYAALREAKNEAVYACV